MHQTLSDFGRRTTFQVQDVLEADALVLGAPGRQGGMCGEMRMFLDTLADLQHAKGLKASRHYSSAIKDWSPCVPCSLYSLHEICTFAFCFLQADGNLGVSMASYSVD